MTTTDKITILSYKDFTSLYNYKIISDERMTKNLQAVVANYHPNIDDEEFEKLNNDLCSKMSEEVKKKIGDHFYEIEIQNKYRNRLNNREIITDGRVEFTLETSDNSEYLERISIQKKDNLTDLRDFLCKMIKSPSLLLLHFEGDIYDLKEKLSMLEGCNFESISSLLYESQVVNSFVIQSDGSWIYRFKAFFINSYNKILNE